MCVFENVSASHQTISGPKREGGMEGWRGGSRTQEGRIQPSVSRSLTSVSVSSTSI